MAFLFIVMASECDKPHGQFSASRKPAACPATLLGKGARFCSDTVVYPGQSG